MLGARYRIARRLGAGGMSEVWLADDSHSRHSVALKILLPELAARPGFVELLAAEAASLKQLEHPNIVRLFGFEAADNLHLLVLEYLPGSSLTAMRGAAWQKVVRKLLPVAAALEHAHRLGIVHRDLKPGNILLDAAGAPKLTDFGIAGLLKADPASQPRGGGSLPVMSPQQLSGAAPAVTDDIYSFGALLYELICGAPLFAPEANPQRVHTEIPPALRDNAIGGPAPESLSELVSAMLSKQPASRPADMAAVRVLLTDILQAG